MCPAPLKRDVRIDLGEDRDESLATIGTDHLESRHSPFHEIGEEGPPFGATL
jgi:hypothetical protein